MEEIISKGTFLPYSYYANNDDQCVLVPSWVAGGIFPLIAEDGTNDSKSTAQKRRKVSHKSRNGIQQLRRSNLEHLVYNEIRNCDVCSRSILWTPQIQQSYFGQSNDDETITSIAISLPHFVENHIQSQSAIPCSFCHRAHTSIGDAERHSWCGTLFCSAGCQQKGEHSSGTAQSATAPILLPKHFFCRNRISKCMNSKQKADDSLYLQEVLESIDAIEQRLRSLCGPVSEELDSFIGVEECALLMVTLIACCCPWWTNGLLQLSSKVNNTNQVGNAKKNTSSSLDLDPDEEDVLEEMWAMSNSYWCLLQSSVLEAEDTNTGSGNDSLQTNSSQSFILFPEFLKLYVFIKRHCLVEVSPSPHPLVSYATKKLVGSKELSEDDRKIALDTLQPSTEEANNQNHNQETLVNGSTDSTQSLIVLWRKATHFSHWISTRSSEENDQYQKRIYTWLHKSYFAFSPLALSALKHTCVPTLAMVMNDLDGKTVSGEDDENSSNNLSWLALHDFPIGEASISKIDSDAIARKAELERLMGRNYVCTCEKCQYESGHASTLTTQQLKRLGDVAMQQGQYEDATSIYQSILDVEPCNADALHAKAASFLGQASSTTFANVGHCQGFFLRAQYLWSKAASNKSLAKHPDISVHLVKQEAFGTIQDLQCTREASTSSIQCSSFLDDKVFLTNDNTPIIALAECQTAIQAAEDYAKASGWTTSRHYAVPTTDIALHELKSIVPWFRDCWDKRIRPLLRHQFKLTFNKPSSTSKDIFIHDAFVVRYDAEGGQRNLPPHYDESTHSFIIALNTNYEGGGTYIHRLGKALKPGAAGGMISFCGGELLHSGDTVVKGVRYIIVAFCYVDLITLGGGDSHPDTNKQLDQGPESSQPFSFGFSF